MKYVSMMKGNIKNFLGKKMLWLLNGPWACLGFVQTQWRGGGETFGLEVLRWWSVKRSGAKAVGKTHFV